MNGTQSRLSWPVVSSDFWRDMQLFGENGDSNGRTHWKPAALVAESDDGFLITLEVPGVTTDSIEIDVDGEHLTIAGERPEPTAADAYRILRAEAPWGRFHRRFRLGSDVDRDAISASHRAGMLEITVPKRQEAKPRRIPVSTEA